MTCFKYQVYLYGSEAITFLNPFLWVVTGPAPVVIIRLPSPPNYRKPSSLSVWQHNLHPFGRELSMAKLPYLC